MGTTIVNKHFVNKLAFPNSFYSPFAKSYLPISYFYRIN